MKRFTVAASILALTVAAVPAAAADDVMSPAAGIAAAGLAAADVELSLPTINYSRGAVLPTLYVSLAGLQAYDVYATTTGLRRGIPPALITRWTGTPYSARRSRMIRVCSAVPSIAANSSSAAECVSFQPKVTPLRCGCASTVRSP